MLSRFAMLLIERRRRAAQAQAITPEMDAWTDRMRPIATRLRGEMHPKQLAFWSIRLAGQLARELRRAAKTTRRSGKTSGGTREILARCLEHSGYRAVYCNTTLAEAIKLVWRSDTGRDGWLELLRIHGLRVAHKRAELDAGKADCFVDDKLHLIEFKNGSQIAIFCADDAASIEKIRGQAKHVVWIDEAQKFGHLQTFVEDILEGNLTDFVGELLLTGTPSKAAGSYYYDVTKEPEQGERADGWEVHEWSLLDNPFFGNTEAERFDRALKPRILRVKPKKWQLSPEEWVAQFCAKPPAWFSREYLGKWILTDAFFVYAIHEVPTNERTYAPMRTTTMRPFSPEGRPIASIDMSNGWYDHAAAVADLPMFWRDHRRKKHPIRWLVAAAFDFGNKPDPFAVNLAAWSLDVEDIYELWSWKQTELHPDDARDIVRWVLANVDSITVCVGDAGGLQGWHMQGWRERLGVQIEDAQKHGKRTWQELLSGEISALRYHYREASPLLDEHEHLLWKVDKDGNLVIPNEENADRALSDRRLPGNHCCLVAGTMVRTPSGEIPIEAIRVGDLVETRRGPRAVTRAWCVGEWPTWNLEAGPHEVVGTGNHKVWTQDGWRYLELLTEHDTLTAWESTDHRSQSNSSASHIAATPSRPGENCVSTSPRSVAVDSIARSGNMPMDPCRQGSTFTTSTTIRSITSWTTWLLSLLVSTWRSTRAGLIAWLSRVGRLSQPLPSLQPGTDLMPAEPGTHSTLARSSRRVPRSASSVSCVEAGSSRLWSPRFAPLPVMRSVAETLASMTSTARATNAARSSGVTDTNDPPDTALVPVRSVRETGRTEAVYDLTVEGEHEFFANGILVSNSDCGLYGFRHLVGRKTEFMGRDPIDPDEKMRREEAEMDRDIDRMTMSALQEERDDDYAGSGYE